MCPGGPRWRTGRLRAEGREGRAPPNFGRVSGGAFVPEPLAGKLCWRYLYEVPCWCTGEAAGFRAPGGRAGEGGSILGSWHFSPSAGCRDG